MKFFRTLRHRPCPEYRQILPSRSIFPSMRIRILGERFPSFTGAGVCVIGITSSIQQSVCNTMRQMMICTQLMCHGMADTQECIGKCHTGHGGSIPIFSLATGSSAPFRKQLQICKIFLGSHQRKASCIIRCHDGRIRLQKMGQSIDTGCAGQTFG